ncbi:putative class i alpha-mannosidase 1a [Diaporthe ampelina]|uniref:alpha-1,2-Mannosidase n=1 Tax=Diaporthe ampelina TaxID=1214573 RepID=A0A0G2FQC4_9PEZI|nr:putative class i alpha-mannosidase 1a [Diaporthe ampelina]
MIHLRRYRVFVACAFVFVFLLYRVSVNSAGDSNNFVYEQAAVQPNPPQPQAAERDQVQKPLAEQPPPTVEDTFVPDLEEEKVKIPNLKTTTEVKDGFALPPAPTLAEPTELLDQGERPKQEPPTTTEPPAPLIPDRRPGKVEDTYPHAVDEPLHIQDPPGRFQGSPVATTTSTTIHWEKQPEWFPVPEGSLIPLPTGKPKSVPRVQYNFGSESADAKAKREERLAEVKAEMKRAWDGYEKYAFGHDELVPVGKSFKDPFCGWAATMVDAMDTLWIMGLKEEFDSAYKGLKDIDFTTTPHRNEIPVFETTIRYLGGLLAAYDVSGGHKGDYPLLLNKAVELAEVLMGIFDTPNRMPVLYYKWKPAYASQPKRGSTRAGVAELGTLSMEFTRLAQLTGKDKYYDAVARITDALEEWQNRDDDTAPTVPGIFPENVDTSGCNASATEAIREASLQAQQQAETAILEEPQGYVPPAAGSSGAIDVSTQGRPSVEFQVKPGGEGSPEVGGFRSVAKREVGDYDPQSGVPPPNAGQIPDLSPSRRAGASSSRFQSHEPAEPLAANGLPANWECVASNLTTAPGIETFSMGGSQDSAYEYFPKQYLLLGGLEPKYRTLHEKTVAAVKKWLLFRPMAPDDPDILFSAKIRISGGHDTSLSERMAYEYEVTHLTCFLGGMFGLGAKIFDSPDDLEIGKRLTDGVDPATLDQQAIKEKMKKLEAELDRYDETTGRTSSSGAFGGLVGQVPIDQAAINLPPRPVKPDTHEEYVQKLIIGEGLPPGFTRIGDRRYILRPEAIESVWYMYRITGDPIWQEKGWKMWQAVVKHTRSQVANTAVDLVNSKDGTTAPIDSMESFWLAETLKYYYLLYSDTDLISLDDWVLNTEAHPFPRPR